MARTKAQVVKFLNSQVGKKVNSKAGVYNGQCVSLIKALLEYVGAPNPYGARGHAKDYNNSLLREGIAKNGKGAVNVCVNPNMGVVGGVTYGHIWVSIPGDANYEQNGAKPLLTTKNTRPISQARQIVNLDKYIKEEEEMLTEHVAEIIVRFYRGTSASKVHKKEYVGKVTAEKFARLVGSNKDQRAHHEKLAKAGKLDMVNHLPLHLRKILK